METDGGGWTVFQRRKDGSVDFNRGWNDYERGFGELSVDYWLGLARLYQLLELNGANELRIDLKDASSRNSAYAKYSSFSVGNSSSKYRLRVSGYSGTAGDAIAASGDPRTNANGMNFSTKDQDNDESRTNCASSWKGGWWFKDCQRSFLNSMKSRWYNWKLSSAMFSEMKFRKV